MDLSAPTGEASAGGRALVVRVDFGACALRVADGSTLDATVRGRLMGHRKSLGNAVVVGDEVGFEREAGRVAVIDVSPRRNSFSRRAAGVRPVEQVMAANLDQIVLVASISDPEFKAGFADRVLAQAELCSIPVVLAINKVDLGGREETQAILEAYGRAGYSGLMISARTHEQVDQLRERCRGLRTLFVGHSGVGKSTLLNSLAPGLGLGTGEVNQRTGKGKHTTSAAWLQQVPPDLELIDTPGMRGFGLWDIADQGLEQCYPEFRPVLGRCRFGDCRHNQEPGCALREAVAAGTIAHRRFESFLKLREELAEESSGERPRSGGTAAGRSPGRPEGGVVTAIMTPAWNPALLGFDCLACGRRVEPQNIVHEPVCGGCGQPLVATYDAVEIDRIGPAPSLDRFGHDLWRHRAALPFAPGFEPVRLGEGGTPLIPLAELAREIGVAELWLKDEAGNATQSFKARGLALAVSAARALGIGKIALPSAGNAGSAAAAYAAAAGIACRITVPEDTPETFILEQRALGAEVRLVPGTIAEAGHVLREWAKAPEWWNVATFREPFRLEGKKTLGYEIAEALGWRLPDVVLYPTGGGTGLVGMERAFGELIAMGRVAPPVPRLIAVQAENCAPIVRAFGQGARRAERWDNASTVASGLRVPSPFADALILRAIASSGGTAVSVSDDAMLRGMLDLAARAGCFACPEGGASLAALRSLAASAAFAGNERVVIYNTGSGLKYLEAWRAARSLVQDAVRER